MISKIVSIIIFPIIWTIGYFIKLINDIRNLNKVISKYDSLSSTYSKSTLIYISILTLVFDLFFGIFIAILLPIYMVIETFKENINIDDAFRRAYYRFNTSKMKTHNKVKNDDVIDGETL